jgi:hypothetical protein
MVWYCGDITKAAILVLSEFQPWVGSPETIIISSSVAGSRERKSRGCTIPYELPTTVSSRSAGQKFPISYGTQRSI